MEFQTILLERTGSVATLTLNRPDALNAINQTMGRELEEALNRVQSDPEARLLVLKGAGRAFCAGGDLREMAGGVTAAQGVDFIGTIGRVTLALANLDRPVIASVHGFAVGAGCNLAIAADIVIAAEGTRFAQPFVTMGLVPDGGGTYFLPRLIGLARAKYLAFTAERIDAAEAERIGLISRVVPAEELDARVAELADKLAGGPAIALRLAKAGLNASFQHDLAAALEYESVAQALCFQTEDHREGARAFLEKRSPRFSGR